jgi:hypothetical protein
MKYILLLGLWIVGGIASGQNDSLLSNQAQVSLLTFDPGTEVYSIWGHTAIRIKDPGKNINKVYNYGTFDFDQPGFLWKFLKGKLNYSLSYAPYDKVVYFYKYVKRGMFEQVLNLSYYEKIKLVKALRENYQKENRYYKYDFFFDNCSTRPLNIIEKSVNGILMLKKPKEKITFRQLLDRQISNYKWIDFGIDLIIGNKADKIPTPRQSSFLPLNLMKTLSKAKVEIKPDLSAMQTNKTVIKKLVKSSEKVFDFDQNIRSTPLIITPIWIFTFLFLLEIVIFYLTYKNGKIIYKWYDNLWFGIALAGSIIIVFLWFFTDHQATKNNWNLLWLNPFYLFMFFKGKIKKIFALIISILLFITLAGISVIPQEMNPAIIPIAGLLLLKVAKYGFFSYKND